MGRRRKTIRCAGVCLLLLLAAAPTAAAALPDRLTSTGRWLTDPKGRVTVLHGLQIDKWKPDRRVNIIDLSPEHLRFMASHGFNLSRTSITYSGVEPVPGQFDEAYLNSFLAFDRELAKAGIHNLLDMMQGQYSEEVGGWGMPDWMTATGGAPNNREPFGRGYLINPAQYTTWDNFWANAPAADGVGLQDHYARGLDHIARRFASAPGLLGIEIMNEPWAGSPWITCASPTGCPPGGFDQTKLTAFYRKMIPVLRKADARRPIFYEPNLLFDFGAATGLGDLGGDKNLVFAFHNYCLGRAPGLTYFPDPVEACQVNENIVLDNAEAREKASGHPVLMDEWGNDPDPILTSRVAGLADERMIGWAAWAYEDCCNSPAAVIKDGTKPPTGDNVNMTVLKALTRPYPQKVAGTPVRWSFAPSSRRFELEYSTRRADGRGRFPARSLTEVFVPRLHYGSTYRLRVRGAEVSSGSGTQRPILRSCPGAQTVTVEVTDGKAIDQLSCPEQAALARPCLPRRLSVSGRGIGPARLGRSLSALSRRYRVTGRTRGRTRLCVRGGGRLVARAHRDKIVSAYTTASRHATRQAAPGQRPRRARIRGARKVRGGLLVGQRRGRAGRVVYGVRRGRVRYLAVVRRRDAAGPRRLLRELRRIGLLRS